MSWFCFLQLCSFHSTANIYYRTYVEALCEEINDLLQDQGQVTIADLTKTYDLPAEFLSEVRISIKTGTKIQYHHHLKQLGFDIKPMHWNKT